MRPDTVEFASSVCNVDVPLNKNSRGVKSAKRGRNVEEKRGVHVWFMGCPVRRKTWWGRCVDETLHECDTFM